MKSHHYDHFRHPSDFRFARSRRELGLHVEPIRKTMFLEPDSHRLERWLVIGMVFVGLWMLYQ